MVRLGDFVVEDKDPTDYKASYERMMKMITEAYKKRILPQAVGGIAQ